MNTTNNTFNISPIYVPNHDCEVIEWLPTIDHPIIRHPTDSWYEISERRNFHPISTPVRTIQYPIIPPGSLKQQIKQINRLHSNKKPGFIYTKKIRLYPDKFQKFILSAWFTAAAKMFNITTDLLQKRIFNDGILINYQQIKQVLNLEKTKIELKIQRKQIQVACGKKIQDEQKKIHQSEEKILNKKFKFKINKGLIPIHLLDESIAQAISNLKSCVSNFKSGKIKKFKIKHQQESRRTKILKIESERFNSGTFCSRTFPHIASSEPLTGIEKTCTLQYSHITKKYILFVPTILEEKKRKVKKLSAGIDLGVTPFIAVYSQNKTFSICDMNNKNISRGIERNQKKVRRLDNLISGKIITNNIVTLEQKNTDNNNRRLRNEIQKLKVALDVKKDVFQDDDYSFVDLNKLKKAKEKYNMRKQNKIKDMHFKTSYMLTHEFDKISIGKLNISSLLSKENYVVSAKTKETMKILSPYAFRQRLQYMGYKYGTPVKEVSEYLTTKTCSSCGRTKEMGGLKVYKCECGMKANRDENSAKTHMKIGIMLERALLG